MELKDGTYLVNGEGELITAPFRSGYYVATHETSLEEAKPGQLVGVWTNPETGRTHIDNTRWVYSRETAIELGKRHNQLAIWDIKNKKEIWQEQEGDLAVKYRFHWNGKNPVTWGWLKEYSGTVAEAVAIFANGGALLRFEDGEEILAFDNELEVL